MALRLKMSDPPITQWITGAKGRDAAAESDLWKHYFEKVVRLARGRMFALQGTVYDEEDAAASALRSVFRGLQAERFPELDDRHNFWRIVVVVTQRKLRGQWRKETAGRRRPDPAEAAGQRIDINELISTEPTPEFITEMMDETESLLERLGDETLRRITLLRMDGMTNDEIASQLGCATKTVERKLERIRAMWDVADEK